MNQWAKKKLATHQLLQEQGATWTGKRSVRPTRLGFKATYRVIYQGRPYHFCTMEAIEAYILHSRIVPCKVFFPKE